MQDGTFVFHSYSKIKNGFPSQIITYGKGKWNVKDNVITFAANKQEDFDKKYTVDFSNSVARFVTKNLRDKSGKIILTRLTFLKSEIFWIQKLDVFKL